MASRAASFARWRRERPFWGAVLTIVAGVHIYAVAAGPLEVLVMQGMNGLMTMGVALIAVIMGGVTLAQPVQRLITGWIVLVLGPISILATNLGGFIIGMILLVIGGSLILAWVPPEAEAAPEPMPDDDRPRPAWGEEEPSLTDDIFAGSGRHVENAPIATAPSLKAPSLAVADGAGTAMRNPWRARPVEKVPQPVEPTTEATIEPSTQPTTEPGTEATTQPTVESMIEPSTEPGTEAMTQPSTEPGSTPSRSWFARSDTRVEPGAMEPPKLHARSTVLVVPAIVLALLASGFAAAPARASTTSGLFDWLLNPGISATPTPTPQPTPAPSPPATSAPDLPPAPAAPQPTPGDPAAGPSAEPTTGAPAELPSALCPADDPPPGTTRGGQAAIDGAAAVQACQQAEATAEVTGSATDGVRVSNLISVLTSPRLEMSGFRYNGIVPLDSPNGPVRTLSFTLDELTITDYDHVYPFGAGSSVTLQEQSRVVLSGNVQLNVTSMSGKIYGLLELTFTPDFAPPLVLPSMFFTDTTSNVVFVKADRITLPRFRASAS